MENEEHFLMHCPLYSSVRTNLNEIIHKNANVRELTEHNQFIWLMSNEDKEVCKALGKFLWEALNVRSNHYKRKKTPKN